MITPPEDHGGDGSIHAGYGAHQQIVTINLEKLREWLTLVTAFSALLIACFSWHEASIAEREGRLAQYNLDTFTKEQFVPLKAGIEARTEVCRK
jgi:hypothetical protein